MMNISIQKPDVRTISRSDLVDIRQVKIDPSLSKQDRIKSFVSQIRNPYCYLDGDVVVGVSYADTEISLEDRLKSYVCNLA